MNFNKNFERKLVQKREKLLFYSSELCVDYNGIVLQYISRKVIDSNLTNLGFFCLLISVQSSKKRSLLLVAKSPIYRMDFHPL